VVYINRKEYERTLGLLSEGNVSTICLEANCPNRYECFSNKVATFLILGPNCSRNCKYCNVHQGNLSEVNDFELKSIVALVKKLNLKYVVITSVCRDDLLDGGVSQFLKIKDYLDELGVSVEFLIPDFNGDLNLISKIVKSKPRVINHNIETVESLFNMLRPQGDYFRSLKLLNDIKLIDPKMITKSGFMLGLGESFDDIKKTLVDLNDAKVDLITIGEYFSPSNDHFEKKKTYTNSDFDKIRKFAESLDFKKIYIGKFVRSSYGAEEMANLGL